MVRWARVTCTKGVSRPLLAQIPGKGDREKREKSINTLGGPANARSETENGAAKHGGIEKLASWNAWNTGGGGGKHSQLH